MSNTAAAIWRDGGPGPFLPELILCLTIFLMLLVRLFKIGQRVNVFFLALVGSIAALVLIEPWILGLEEIPREELFTGMLVHDGFSTFIRGALVFFAILFSIFTRISGIPDRDDSADFYCLVLGATLGMCLMATANHLLMIFLAIEMASVPSYALAAMLKGRKESSEAALKYSIYGAGAAGVMLYGISLLAGVVGTAHLPTLAAQLSDKLPGMAGGELMVLSLAGLMIMVGLAFKLSAVPFHFWCPDVFEGASAEVNAFLSVASKAAALALLVRVALGVGLIPSSASESVALNQPSTSLMAVADTVEATPSETAVSSTDPLSGVRTFMAILIGALAALTCTFGNLAAYGQTNIKRLFAYSTIAHAGYMMLPIPVALMFAVSQPTIAQRAIAALVIYIGIYLFMNLGAFAIVAFLRNKMHSEEIKDYAGMVRTSPGIVVCFAVILFSLVGLPPLAGFIGKFAIFASLAEGIGSTGSKFLWFLLIVGGVNTAISLFYYLRVAKVMAIDLPSEDAPAPSFSMTSLSGIFVALVTLPMLLLFINWEVLSQWSQAATKSLF